MLLQKGFQKTARRRKEDINAHIFTFKAESIVFVSMLSSSSGPINVKKTGKYEEIKKTGKYEENK